MTTTTSVTTVESLMTRDPIRVGGGMSASDLAVVLDENEISGVPVVDPQDRVIGVVSRTDLLRRCVEGPLGAQPHTYLSSIAQSQEGQIDTDELGVVSEFMNPDAVVAEPSTPVDQVAQQMADERVHRVVIVDEDRHVIGIVTSLDLLTLVTPRKNDE